MTGNVERPDVRGAVRYNTPMTLPVDDPRNNARFRRLFPNVKFEGKSKNPKKVLPGQYPSVQRNNPNVSLVQPPNLGNPSSHSSPNNTVPSAQVADQLAERTNTPEVDPNENPDNLGAFSFYDVASEGYTAGLDSTRNDSQNSNINRVGANTGATNSNLTNPVNIPTNLNVYNITLSPQISSGDGIATYVATVSFDAPFPADDYEVRLVKQ